MDRFDFPNDKYKIEGDESARNVTSISDSSGSNNNNNSRDWLWLFCL
jgi:hypothetical protein